MRTMKSRIYQDWDHEGSLVIRKPKTLATYRKLTNSRNELPLSHFNMFAAFNKEQFEEGMREAGIKDGEKVCSLGAGVYGKREGIDRWIAYQKDKNSEIRHQCDHQEVYVYEYNNHECMFDFDGDRVAVEHIINIFGEEAAKKLKRFSDCYPVEQIIKEFGK